MLEQSTTTLAPAAATDEPAVPSTAPSTPPARRPIRPLAHVSRRLADSLIDPALDCGRDVRPDRASRHDGWTPERIRTFLDTLAETGVVADAARAAGMSTTSCYRLRNRTGARPFRLAWTAAEHNARRRIADEAMSRALNGCVEVRVNGDVVEERHRFDNRLLMTVLARLDRNAVANDRENRAARLVAEEFDQFLDLLCAGGEGASTFLATRYEIDRMSDAAPEATMLERSENYARLGVGLPEEVPAADPAPGESWIPYRQECPDRAAHLARPAEEAEEEDEGGHDDGVEKGDDVREDLDDECGEADDEVDEIGARAVDIVLQAAARLMAEAEADAPDTQQPDAPHPADLRCAEPAPGRSGPPPEREGEPSPPTADSAPPAPPQPEPALEHYSGWVSPEWP